MEVRTQTSPLMMSFPVLPVIWSSPPLTVVVFPLLERITADRLRSIGEDHVVTAVEHTADHDLDVARGSAIPDGSGGRDRIVAAVHEPAGLKESIAGDERGRAVLLLLSRESLPPRSTAKSLTISASPEMSTIRSVMALTI